MECVKELDETGHVIGDIDLRFANFPIAKARLAMDKKRVKSGRQQEKQTMTTDSETLEH